MIIDISFIHERPRAIAAWFITIGFLPAVILAVLPYTFDMTTLWRPFYFAWAFPSAATLFLAFFLAPETYFLRPPVAFDGRIYVQSGNERLHIYDNWEQLPSGKTEEPQPQPQPQPPPQSRIKDWFASLKVFSCSRSDWKPALACYPQMLRCFINPLIFWVVLLSAFNFGILMVLNLTYPVLLSQPPYNLTSHTIATVSLAGAFGTLLAWPASYMMIDVLPKRLARQNGGVRHAEYILPGYVLPVLTSALSAFLYGVVAERKLQYGLVYVAWGLATFGWTGLSIANTLWITEAFPRWAAAAIAVVAGTGYVISFALSSAIKPWLRLEGYLLLSVEMGTIYLVIGFVGVPIAFWGKGIRQYINGRWGSYEAGALRPQ
jgi:hypothetical protein